MEVSKIKIGVLLTMTLLVISGIVMAANGKVMPIKLGENNGIFTPHTYKVLTPSPADKYVPDEIIVKFKPGTSDEVISEINSRHGGFVKYTSRYGKFKRMGIPKGKTVSEMVETYEKEENVEYAEPNYIVHALMVPNDPYYKYQWHLDNAKYGGINTEEAWDIQTGTRSVIVAVVDTGIAYEDYGKYCQAPDLAQTCFVQGYDFVNNDAHPNDDNNHGTHVAGTIAQSTNNDIGVAGIAFNTCLMPVKVLDRRGSGTYADVANGIYYAVNQGAKVISLSLGGSADSKTLKDAVKYAYDNGVTVVAACGNDNEPSCAYPAAYDDYVIAVGATQYDETKAPYSNYGPSLDLVAPGGNTDLDQNGDGYADGVLQQTFAPFRYCTFRYYFFQGTSMATPHVSGVAALVISNGNADANGDGITSPDEVRADLEGSAEDLGEKGRDDTYGYGLVDAAAALRWTAGADTVAPTITIEKPTDRSVTNSQEVSFVVRDNVDVNETSISVTINGTTSAVFNPVANCTTGTTEVSCSYVELGIAEGSNTLTIDAKDTTGNAATQAETTFTYDVTPPEKVTNLTVTTVSDSQLNLSWDPTTEEDLDHYNVYRSTISNGSYGLIASPTANSYSDTGLAASTTYYYIVSAVDKAGNEGEKSDEASGTTEAKTTVKCWSAENQYLYRNKDQAKKFCKCATGIYGYNSYKYNRGRKTVYYYVDSENNENWEVASRSSYLPVYQVTCTDGMTYQTNKDY